MISARPFPEDSSENGRIVYGPLPAIRPGPVCGGCPGSGPRGGWWVGRCAARAGTGGRRCRRLPTGRWGWRPRRIGWPLPTRSPGAGSGPGCGRPGCARRRTRSGDSPGRAGVRPGVPGRRVRAGGAGGPAHRPAAGRGDEVLHQILFSLHMRCRVFGGSGPRGSAATLSWAHLMSWVTCRPAVLVAGAPAAASQVVGKVEPDTAEAGAATVSYRGRVCACAEGSGTHRPRSPPQPLP